MRKTGVYSITNLIDGKMIIGSGILKNRRNFHFNNLKKNKHCNPYLQNAVNEHGIENFVFDVVEYCEHDLCIKNETWWIYFLDTKNTDKGYNINDPEKMRLGVSVSQETRDKISKFQKNHEKTEEHKRRLLESRKGIPLSEEHKKNIGNANRGRKATEEQRLNMSIAAKNRPKITLTEEHKRKIGLAHKGKIISEEQKKKISEFFKGKPSPRKGVKLSEETKLKISLAKKAWFAKRKNLDISNNSLPL